MKDFFVLLLKHRLLITIAVVSLAVVWLLIGAGLSTWMNVRALRKWRKEHGRSSTDSYRDTDF